MSNKLFNTVKMSKPSRNVFDLTHDVKLTCNMGQLIPICAIDAVPGDRFNISAESLIRFQPMIAPVMHRMNVSIHYFFVPNRIIWPNWEAFITDDVSNSQVGDSPTQAPPIIYVDGDKWNSSKLYDYMGIPDPAQSTGTEMEAISALPFAAFQRCWYEYYRDQNMQDENIQAYMLSNGTQPDDATFHAMRNRAWEHDYFTSCLPWAQKGGAVDIPLGDVQLVDNWQALPGTQWPNWNFAGIGPLNTTQTIQSGSSTGVPNIKSTGDATNPIAYDPNGSLQVEPTTINDLRRAFRLQEFLEKDARGGTRYTEYIRAHFGVTSSDKRLQRPEYITGTRTPVVISEVLNTTGTEDLPQGNMAGHGIAVVGGKNGSYSCEEHGWIIGIMSVMPKTAYQQGIARKFLRNTSRYDYYHPEFAHIGEQAVANRELYAYTASGGDAFGYNPRFSEYKFESNRVAGDMRNSLDFWHLGRIFLNQPALNASFVVSDPTKRIFAVDDPEQDALICHVLNKIRAVRPMPFYGTPSF